MITGTLHKPDARVIQYYDVTPGAAHLLPVIYHHGSPNVGEPPAPLFKAAERLGLRWVGYDRPGYGGSTAQPGRSVGHAAWDVAAVADELGLDRYAVFGHSGGGAHALACAALTPDRVVAAVSVSGLAPYGAAGLDWFEGLNAGGEAELRAAVEGPHQLAKYLETEEFDPAMFTASDWDALNSDWSWMNGIVEKAQASGPGPFIDDDVATVNPWGFAPSDIAVPTLIMHGSEDHVVPAAHGRWLAAAIDGANLLEVAGAGHISVLRRADEALAWIAAHAAPKND